MDAHSDTQAAFFPDLLEKPLLAVFDSELTTSDGGAILLHAKDQQLGVIGRVAAAIEDRRAPARAKFSVEEILRQRVLGMGCGYSDANDAASLRTDPVMKMCSSRSPASGDSLASQPTVSRFENSITLEDASRMQAAFMDSVLEACRRRYGKRVRRVIIDLDPTDDPTYGSQQLSLFNGFYGNHCYLPMMGFVSFDDHPEQHIVAAVLRPGNAPGTQSALDILNSILVRITRLFPRARVLVRLDGAFSTPEILDWLDGANRIDYVVSMAKNPVLERLVEPKMLIARALSEVSGDSQRVYGSTTYAAKSWGRHRRVVLKAEVTRYRGRDPRDNPRFVVTNLKNDPELVYRLYCGRGDCENRIKEMKLDLNSGRTSCTRFEANQLRLTMAAVAFMLIQELRADLHGTGCERASVATIRCRLLKIGARIAETSRRFVMHMPSAFPWIRAFQLIAGVT